MVFGYFLSIFCFGLAVKFW